MPTLRETAEILVAAHREVEPNLRRVLFFEDPGGREVRLVEIVDGSPSTETVLPFRFTPNVNEGILYPVVLVELSPDEFARLEGGELTLPDGWDRPEVLYAA
jgi:hypothetical protein